MSRILEGWFFGEPPKLAGDRRGPVLLLWISPDRTFGTEISLISICGPDGLVFLGGVRCLCLPESFLLLSMFECLLGLFECLDAPLEYVWIWFRRS